MTADTLRRHLAALGAHVDAVWGGLETLGPEGATPAGAGARGHLAAMRGHVDAVLAELVEELAEAPAPSDDAAGAADPATCPHPEDERRDASSMRNPHRFRCGRCGALINHG